ncbi:hypothetical protein HanIR_Chr12g0570431 [Helianthus annuus]|nr:hypothetical protein HanIR_Chr12g0570431 [Helianthus annuus]
MVNNCIILTPKIKFKYKINFIHTSKFSGLCLNRQYFLIPLLCHCPHNRLN